MTIINNSKCNNNICILKNVIRLRCGLASRAPIVCGETLPVLDQDPRRYMLHENTYEPYGLIFFQKMKLQSCTPLCPTCYESLAFLKLVFHDFFLDDTGHHT
jgi:hypothetical protein